MENSDLNAEQPATAPVPLPPPPPAEAISTLQTVLVTIVVAGVAVTLLGGSPSCTMGASRSMRLQFEKRQSLIQAAASSEITAPGIAPNEILP